MGSPFYEIERCAFGAWPAAEVCRIGPWFARAMSGVTRRANSVWTAAPEMAAAGEDAFDAVDRFYSERGLPSRFQLSPASVPVDLDVRLAERGFVVDCPTVVCTLAASELGVRSNPGLRSRVEAAPFAEWFELSGHKGRFRGVQDVYRGLLDRLEGRGLFALVELGGEPAAVGLGVVDGEYCGISSMLTLAAHRRKGAASAVLGALATAATERGASTLFLQVERDNEAARALYARFGFVDRYQYHYRQKG